MVKVSYLCDRCGKEVPIESELSFLKFENKNGEAISEDKETCFCRKCVRDITKYAAKRSSVYKQSITEIPEEVLQRFDINKAVALRKSGWSFRDIADEFGLPYKATYDRMQKWEKENGIIKVSSHKAKPLEFGADSLPEQKRGCIEQPAYYDGGYKV